MNQHARRTRGGLLFDYRWRAGRLRYGFAVDIPCGIVKLRTALDVVVNLCCLCKNVTRLDVNGQAWQARNGAASLLSAMGDARRF